jgi:hypothetical protein
LSAPLDRDDQVAVAVTCHCDCTAALISPASIVPAAQSTFELIETPPRFGIAAQQEDVYAGGRSYFTEAPSGRSFGAEFDLAFRIAAVDELPAPLLLLAGLATVWARRWPLRRTG